MQEFCKCDVVVTEFKSLLDLLQDVNPSRKVGDKYVWWLGGVGFLVVCGYDIQVGLD